MLCSYRFILCTCHTLDQESSLMRAISYPAYKPSGVEWLGGMPAHWEMRRTKSILKERCLKGFSNEPLLAATQTKGVVRKEHYENRTVLAFKDLHLLKLVYPGDFVISLRSFQGGIEYARDRGIISPAYTILYPENPDIHGYLAWLFKSKPYIENLTLQVTGIRQGQNIDYGRLSISRIPLPPLSEQTAIVRYLDHMDERIRRYLSGKQKLIRLLEEEKEAVINRAVTGQVDVTTGQPYSAYKPSGIPWLGDVPAYWEVMPLRRLAISRCDGPFGSGLKSSHYTDQGIRVVRLQNIGHAQFNNLDSAFIDPSHYATLGDHTVEPEDLLIAGLGDEHHPAGRACVAPSFIVPAMVKADCFRFRLFRQRINPEFAALQLSATAGDASPLLSTGATRQRTNLQATASRPIAVPPTQEQCFIVAYIKKTTIVVDTAISRARRQIELLQEYRTRLIADVVTGQLDVREAARMPEVDSLEIDPGLAREQKEVAS